MCYFSAVDNIVMEMSMRGLWARMGKTGFGMMGQQLGSMGGLDDDGDGCSRTV